MRHFLYFLLFIPLICFSNPAPFGLEIGKTTISQAKSKYLTMHKVGVGEYTQGEMYEINPSDIKTSGLKNLTLVFSKDKRLMAVQSTFYQGEFDYFFNLLSNKYKLNYKDIPFVGDKSAEFISGETKIFLDAPHMSFEMTLDYIDKLTLQKIQKIQHENNVKTINSDYSSL